MWKWWMFDVSNTMFFVVVVSMLAPKNSLADTCNCLRGDGATLKFLPREIQWSAHRNSFSMCGAWKLSKKFSVQ